MSGVDLVSESVSVGRSSIVATTTVASEIAFVLAFACSRVNTAHGGEFSENRGYVSDNYPAELIIGKRFFVNRIFCFYSTYNNNTVVVLMNEVGGH